MVRCDANVEMGGVIKLKVIHTRRYGYRNVESKLAPDEDTIYYLASLSKAFTTAAVGILVDQGKLKWSTPVREIIPAFSHFDSTIEQESTIIDWLSHRTGLAPKNAMWTQEYGHESLNVMRLTQWSHISRKSSASVKDGYIITGDMQLRMRLSKNLVAKVGELFSRNIFSAH